MDELMWSETWTVGGFLEKSNIKIQCPSTILHLFLSIQRWKCTQKTVFISFSNDKRRCGKNRECMCVGVSKHEIHYLSPCQLRCLFVLFVTAKFEMWTATRTTKGGQKWMEASVIPQYWLEFVKRFHAVWHRRRRWLRKTKRTKKNTVLPSTVNAWRRWLAEPVTLSLVLRLHETPLSTLLAWFGRGVFSISWILISLKFTTYDQFPVVLSFLFIRWTFPINSLNLFINLMASEKKEIHKSVCQSTYIYSFPHICTFRPFIIEVTTSIWSNTRWTVLISALKEFCCPLWRCGWRLTFEIPHRNWLNRRVSVLVKFPKLSSILRALSSISHVCSMVLGAMAFTWFHTYPTYTYIYLCVSVRESFIYAFMFGHFIASIIMIIIILPLWCWPTAIRGSHFMKLYPCVVYKLLFLSVFGMENGDHAMDEWSYCIAFIWHAHVLIYLHGYLARIHIISVHTRYAIISFFLFIFVAIVWVACHKDHYQNITLDAKTHIPSHKWNKCLCGAATAVIVIAKQNSCPTFCHFI